MGWGGVQHFLLGWGEVDVEMGGLPLFLLLYSSITFTLCVEKVKFLLLIFILYYFLIIFYFILYYLLIIILYFILYY